MPQIVPSTTGRSLILALLILAAPGTALAKDKINTTFFGNLAVEGYDTVAYFAANKAIKGNAKFETEYQGANWRFSSAENLARFIAEPEKYAPQYGGYCAYAVAQNGTAGIEPEQFTIVEGKLYLNYNRKIQSRWSEDRDNYIMAADANWPSVLE